MGIAGYCAANSDGSIQNLCGFHMLLLIVQVRCQVDQTFQHICVYLTKFLFTKFESFACDLFGPNQLPLKSQHVTQLIGSPQSHLVVCPESLGADVANLLKQRFRLLKLSILFAGIRQLQHDCHGFRIKATSQSGLLLQQLFTQLLCFIQTSGFLQCMDQFICCVHGSRIVFAKQFGRCCDDFSPQINSFVKSLQKQQSPGDSPHSGKGKFVFVAQSTPTRIQHRLIQA